MHPAGRVKAVHPTVLAIHLRDDGILGGCEQYRFRIPYQEIRDRVKGSVVDWAPLGQVKRWAYSDASTKPTDYDMVVLVRHRPLPYGIEGTPAFNELPQRLMTGLAEMGLKLQGKAHLLDLVDMLKFGGQKVILEYDDDHWTGSRDIGYYDHLPLVQELLKKADAVTVTTPFMRKITQDYATGVPVYILPNCVKWGQWQGWDRWKRWSDDQVILGLTGSVTHGSDWNVLADVLPRIFQENKNVGLVLAGFIPDYFKPLVTRYPSKIYADDKFRDYSEYPGLIRQADIILCPVDSGDDFNKAKSGIKATEGYAAGRRLSNGKNGGAMAIVSPLDYYKKVVGSGNKRGLVVDHTPEAWYEAITAMIRDKETREHYQELGHKWVKENHNIDVTWHLWWSAYSEIFQRKQRR